ncbi:MAG TPA: hypothetical protein VG448_04840 [Solirubrobacterales bacterium]|nr:hypothetical protein [Solirubrobacterales bacterium]
MGALLCAAALVVPAAQAEWLPPVDISEASESIVTPDVALDSEGNATAVWTRWNGTANVVETSFRPAGQGWETPETLAEATSPQIVVDRNGNWTVDWERSAGSNVVIETTSRAPGGSWSEPVEVSEFAQGFDPEPFLAVDWEGNNTIVWVQEETVMSSFRVFAGEWGEPIPLSEGESFTPQAAMDGRGDATAVWMHHEGSHYVVESSYRPEQGEWGEATVVSVPGEEGGNPHVAFSGGVVGNGNSLVVWCGEDEGEERLRAAYRLHGGEWGEPTDVSAPGEEVESPRTAIDLDGNALAVWAGNTGELGADIVHAAYMPLGEEWEDPVALSADGGNGFPNDAVFDSHGNASVIWERWDGTTNLVQTAYRPAGEEWEAPVDLSEEGKQAMDAHIVLDAPGSSTAADGDATAIWTGGEVACEGVKETPCHSHVVQAAGYDPDGLPAVELQAPLEAAVGEDVEVSLPTAGLYSPTIDFGDGEEVATATAAHVYDAPGEYQLTAAGAEELGYRASAQRTIKVLPGGPDEGPGPGSGGSSGSGGGGSSATAPPAQAPLPPSEDACAAAQAGRAKAVAALKRARLKLARAAGLKAHRRLAAIKRHRAAALQRAETRLAAAC